MASGGAGQMTSVSGYRERNSTADRALTILEMFRDDKLVLSAVEVADTLGVARSTAYRYLQTLVQSEFLLEDGRGGFRLGMKVLQLSRLARRSYGLADLAVPEMRALTQRFHQTVLLTRRMGDTVVCIEREESDQQWLRLSYERGTVMSLNAGASAQVLLAWLPDDDLRTLLAPARLKRFTDASVTDADALIERLHAIRSAGHAITYGEVDADAVGIAAPVFGRPDEVIAGLSVVLLRTRVTRDHINTIAGALMETAQMLSAKIDLLAG